MAKTVVMHEHGGPEVLQIEDRPVGDPAAGEVRINHKVCGLNFIDCYQRSGLYPMNLPHAMGMEASGVVDAVGEGVTHLKVGDRVAYASQPPGAYCEARVMPAAQVCPLPDGISFEEGAAMMLKGLTTQYLFHRTTPLKAGDTVLFHAAAGGVGLIACQWAKSEGIRLIGTAGTDEKCQLALDHGASDCINYRDEDWVAKVKELTDGKGVDVVMDSVGKDTFEGSLDCLKPLGMMISFGNASGAVPPFNIGTLGAKGSLKITRPTLFTHIADHATCQDMAQQLFAKVLSGDVKIRIDQRFPLDQVADAHRSLEARKTTGSTVLTI
ncbi:MAG: quinone oxidoreductase [Pseudomonadota bacterium]|uniref:NADPH2:quinone reductase n=1 Tax=Thalassococcus halodurans TaxID=373675 RepID=A0A1H5SQ49_9RHOB|nr:MULTISPECIES: quinone oxidoreductase [Thalassococcus]MBO6868006.1 quinone oxidoreductase [Thalassococcus sp.]MEE3358747.1 quinone oxidoreductase [Pseudomonadota bacterium]SEF52733.1 NADPH2:quinone reductase [Thalassococcus halodurans]